jgi:RNA recognition motif-containing protein
MIKLFVGGFPLEIKELQLAELFAPHGDVQTIKIVRDRKTGKCKGYAFIEIADEEGARNAVAALHDMPMEDRKLTVKYADEAPATSTQSRLLRSFTPKAEPRTPQTPGKIKRPRRQLG